MVIKLHLCLILATESKTLVYIINQSEKIPHVQHEIMARLKNSLALQEVDSVDMCDVIMSLVPIVSRAGTDIEAALQNIPSKEFFFQLINNY